MTFYITTIPSILLLAVLKKVNFRELCRLRQTCQALNSFLNDNENQLKKMAPFKLTIGQPNVSLERHYPYLSCKIRPTDLERKTSFILGNPFLQITSVYFDTISIKSFVSCNDCSQECSRSKKPCLRALLPPLQLSCDRLETSAFPNVSNCWPFWKTISFKILNAYILSEDIIRNIPKECEFLSFHNFWGNLEDYSLYLNFKKIWFGSFFNTTVTDYDTHFENFISILKDGSFHCPESFRFPANINDYHFNHDRLGLVKLFEGENNQKKKINLYFMTLNKKKGALICRTHGKYRLNNVWKLYITENSVEAIVENIVVRMSSYWPEMQPDLLGYSQRLYEKVRQLDMEDWNEEIKEYFNYYCGDSTLPRESPLI